jgi:hypothetical protein
VAALPSMPPAAVPSVAVIICEPTGGRADPIPRLPA